MEGKLQENERGKNVFLQSWVRSVFIKNEGVSISWLGWILGLRFAQNDGVGYGFAKDVNLTLVILREAKRSRRIHLVRLQADKC